MLPKPGQEEGPAKEASVPHRPELSSEQEAAVTLWCHPLPGTELGRCFWMPPCWLEGRGGNKETVCGTEAAALASGQAAPGLRTRRAVSAVTPSTPQGSQPLGRVTALPCAASLASPGSRRAWPWGAPAVNQAAPLAQEDLVDFCLCCVILGKSLTLSEPQDPPCKIGVAGLDASSGCN